MAFPFMCKKEVSVEVMAEKIREGDYNDFGKLLNLCAYIPKETFSEAQKLGYEKEDILQESVVAFLHALHSYDEKKGAGFRTFAAVCIRNHIASILRSGQRSKNSAMLNYVSIDDIDLASKSEPETDWIEKESLFNMKKRIFEVFSFREFRRNFSPILWDDTSRWMCVHIDANRTLSQLSYGPRYSSIRFIIAQVM